MWRARARNVDLTCRTGSRRSSSMLCWRKTRESRRKRHDKRDSGGGAGGSRARGGANPRDAESTCPQEAVGGNATGKTTTKSAETPDANADFSSSLPLPPHPPTLPERGQSELWRLRPRGVRTSCTRLSRKDENRRMKSCTSFAGGSGPAAGGGHACALRGGRNTIMEALDALAALCQLRQWVATMATPPKPRTWTLMCRGSKKDTLDGTPSMAKETFLLREASL